MGRGGVGVTEEDAEEVLNINVVAAVVDFDVVAVEVFAARVVVHMSRAAIARVTGDVFGQHEDDAAVGNAETLDGAVHGEGV